MIHWETVKEFFGFDTKQQVEIPAVIVANNRRPPAPAAPPKKETLTLIVSEADAERTRNDALRAAARVRRTQTNPRQYYRRGGNYYNVDDDSLIEDLILLYVLSELFSEADVPEFNDTVQEYNVPETNIFNGETDVVEAQAEDLLDVDVSETPVVDIFVPEPEPVRESVGSSYSSGYSDSSSSDDSGDGGD